MEQLFAGSLTGLNARCFRQTCVCARRVIGSALYMRLCPMSAKSTPRVGSWSFCKSLPACCSNCKFFSSCSFLSCCAWKASACFFSSSDFTESNCIRSFRAAIFSASARRSWPVFCSRSRFAETARYSSNTERSQGLDADTFPKEMKLCNTTSSRG